MTTANQIILNNTLARKLKTLRWSNRVTAQMLTLLGRSKGDILAALTKAITNEGRPDITLGGLNRLMGSVRDEVGGQYADLYAMLSNELSKFAGDEARFSYDTLKVAIPTEIQAVVPLASVAPAQVAAAALSEPMQGRLLSQWATKQSADTLQTITNIVRSGFIQGRTTSQIIGDVALTQAGQNLAAVTKTAVSHTSAVARDLVRDANSDIIEGDLWVSTLDNHTSPMCIVRDHLAYIKKGDLMVPYKHDVPWGAGPGRLHFCCRSVSVMFTKKASEITKGKLSSATRASMNGPVDSGVNFREWILTQPRSVVEDAFGVTRADLILSGKVKVPELFTDNGTMISLDELLKHLPE